MLRNMVTPSKSHYRDASMQWLQLHHYWRALLVVATACCCHEVAMQILVGCCSCAHVAFALYNAAASTWHMHALQWQARCIKPWAMKHACARSGMQMPSSSNTLSSGLPSHPCEAQGTKLDKKRRGRQPAHQAAAASGRATALVPYAHLTARRPRTSLCPLPKRKNKRCTLHFCWHASQHSSGATVLISLAAHQPA